MKTFKQFQEQLSLSQAFTKAGKPGIPSEPPSSTTSLRSLARRTTSDKAKPKGSNSGIPTVPLNQSSYRGRKEAGRNPKYADNPDYTGPLTKGAGSGTKDKMPGTTPSNNPGLPKLSTSKPLSSTSKIVPTAKPKPKKPNYSNFT